MTLDGWTGVEGVRDWTRSHPYKGGRENPPFSH